MVTFDQVLPLLLRCCEEQPGFDSVKAACVVRDLEGRIRLALDVQGAAALDLGSLEATLGGRLQNWFEPPLLLRGAAAGTPDSRRLADAVLGKGQEWPDGEWEDAAGTKKPAGSRWRKIERRVGKEGWASRAQAAPPWPLEQGRPAIVTFFSFKGGVGRTTLLASTAWQLAKDGRRVCAIDLDVEAPGLGALLGSHPRRGVVDFLVDYLGTGKAFLDDLTAPADALGPEAALVDVIAAGSLTASYFEKLARLDFVGSGLLDQEDGSPVAKGLRELLLKLAYGRQKYDYVLLDSRAGLHDLAGLSLNELSHVDVLVARDSAQSYEGLDLTIEALGRRRDAGKLECLVVQSMAPEDPESPEYKRVVREFREASWRSFERHVYDEEDEATPAEDDDTGAHYPRVVRYNGRLMRFGRLEAVREELLASDFVEVKRRVEELCEPPEPNEADANGEGGAA